MKNHKLVDGVKIALTAEEETVFAARVKAWEDGAFDRGIVNLRSERNRLLAATDWRDLPSYAGPKQAEWRVYRQALRDITVGLDTVEKVPAATFPCGPTCEG